MAFEAGAQRAGGEMQVELELTKLERALRPAADATGRGVSAARCSLGAAPAVRAPTPTAVGGTLDGHGSHFDGDAGCGWRQSPLSRADALEEVDRISRFLRLQAAGGR
eukprot:1250875-Prymnesium_polylepis.1